MPPEPQTPPQSFSTKRRWIVGLNVVLSVLAMMALVIMANYLAARHYTRTQWTTANPNQLSELTLNFLHSLTNQVRIVVCFNKEEALGAYSAVSALLNEYKLACPKLQIEYIDYVRQPGAALLLRERYKNAFPGEDSIQNMILFEYNGRVKAVYEKELYDLDLSEVVSGKSREIKRSAFKGELLFTSTLLNVTETQRQKVCFVQGHKEHQLQDDHALMGYSKFGVLLEQLNADVESLTLLANEIPTNCHLLIIAGPQERFQPDELDKIDKFLNRGGRMLVLFNYLTVGFTRLGLDDLLNGWGVAVGKNAVVDSASAASKQINLGLMLTNFPSPGHTITKPLLRSRLQMVLPRSISKKHPGRPDADTAKVDELVASDPYCLAVTQFEAEGPVPNLLKDYRGSIPVIAAVEKGSIQGLSTDRGVTRLVVAGDSLFLGNAMLSQDTANYDFAVLAINWLLDRSKLMGGIGPRPVKEFNVLMTPSQMFAVRWILLVGVPGAVLALGFLVWFRRRA